MPTPWPAQHRDLKNADPHTLRHRLWNAAAARASCHSDPVLIRHLCSRTGLGGLSRVLPTPDGSLDRGRVFADLACAIADGARGDQ